MCNKRTATGLMPRAVYWDQMCEDEQGCARMRDDVRGCATMCEKDKKRRQTDEGVRQISDDGLAAEAKQQQ